MSKSRSAVVCLLLTAEAAAAAPSQADWARCAAIDAPDTRLACYDALGHRPQPTGNTASTAAAAPIPAQVNAAPPQTSPPLAQADDPKNFGLTAVQQHVARTGPESIKARIARIDSDQVGHTVIALDNDQTWSVTDNDGRIATGDTVTIKHGALTSFILLTSSNHTYHVRRLR